MGVDTLKSEEKETATDDGGFTRRGFVKVAAGALGCGYVAAIGYPIYKYLNAPVVEAMAEAKQNTIQLKDADKLPAGSTLMFDFHGVPSMLIHFPDGTWVGLSAVCTHLGCTLHYQPPDPLIVCPCHGGQYDPKTGKNVGGPPPKPLTKYAVTVEAGHVSVTRPANTAA